MNFVQQPAPTATNATVSLVLGIVGIVLCPICAPIAWVLGRRAEGEIDAAAGSLGGRGLATAGKITGIVGTVLLILYVVAFVAFLAFVGFAISEGEGVFIETVPR